MSSGEQNSPRNPSSSSSAAAAGSVISPSAPIVEETKEMQHIRALLVASATRRGAGSASSVSSVTMNQRRQQAKRTFSTSTIPADSNGGESDSSISTGVYSLASLTKLLAPGSHTHLLSTMDPEEERRTRRVTDTSYGDQDLYSEREPVISPKFDKSAFRATLRTVALRAPVRSCGPLMKTLKSHNLLLDIPKCRTVVFDEPSSTFPVPHDPPTNAAAATDAPASGDSGASSTASQETAYKRILLNAVHDLESSSSSSSTSSTSASSSSARNDQTDESSAPPSTFPLSLLSSDFSAVAASHGAELVPHIIHLSYDFFTFDQIARALLPPSVTVPAGFAITGHVAHLNLRKQQLPYRRLIGELIVEKVTGIRTVVNKIGSINNVYRNFCAEVIGGEPVFVARVKEQNATFEFDFSAVYWNSRLQVEHSRVVALVKPTETVLDPFAGVGPFAVPAGIKGCTVLASDLNPSSAYFMRRNVALNKVEKKVSVYNLDARAFIRAVARQQMIAVANSLASPSTSTSSSSSSSASSASPLSKPVWVDHVVMNLPATAVRFVDSFRGLYTAPFERFAPLPAAPLSNKPNPPPANSPPPPPVQAPPSSSTSSSTSSTSTSTSTSSSSSSSSFSSTCPPLPTRAQLEAAGMRLPIVHCYGFSRDLADPLTDGVRQVEKYLGYKFPKYVPKPNGKFCEAQTTRDSSVSQSSTPTSSESATVHSKPGKRIDKSRPNKGEVSSLGFTAPLPTSPSEAAALAPSASDQQLALHPEYSSARVLAEIEYAGVFAYVVRDVAPSKQMICVSFRLPAEVAFEEWSSVEQALAAFVAAEEAENAQPTKGEEDDDDDYFNGEEDEDSAGKSAKIARTDFSS